LTPIQHLTPIRHRYVRFYPPTSQGHLGGNGGEEIPQKDEAAD